MVSVGLIEMLTKQLNEVTAERDRWKIAAEKNEQTAIETSAGLIDMLSAALADLREMSRCQSCKYLDIKTAHCTRSKPCDTKREWEWRGMKK